MDPDCIHIRIDEHPHKLFHSGQNMIRAAPYKNTGLLLGQLPDHRRLKPEQIISGNQIGSQRRRRIFWNHGLDNFVEQPVSCSLISQMEIAFPDAAFIGGHF